MTAQISGLLHLTSPNCLHWVCLRINDPGQAICSTEDVPHLVRANDLSLGPSIQMSKATRELHSERNGMERHYPPCLLCGALSWRSFDLGQPGNMIKPMTFVSKPGMLNAQVKLKSNSLSTLVNSINLFQSTLSKSFRSCFVHDPNLHPTGCTVVSFLTESIDLRVNMGQVV